MAAIREKEACIQLLQGPPDSTKEKIEILIRQKEQLRHRLLTQSSESYSVSEGGPYLANVWFAAQQQEPSTVNPYPFQQSQFPPSKMPSHRVQPSYSNYVQSGFTSNGKLLFELIYIKLIRHYSWRTNESGVYINSCLWHYSVRPCFFYVWNKSK
jgi:hypothetical protein